MPIYEYRCMHRKAEYEALRKMSEYDQDIICPVCGEFAHRILSPPARRGTSCGADSDSAGDNSSRDDSYSASIINCKFDKCDVGISIPRSAPVLMRGNEFGKDVKTPIEFRDE